MRRWPLIVVLVLLAGAALLLGAIYQSATTRSATSTTAAPGAEQTDANAWIRTTMGRPLCIVVTMGKNVELEPVQALARRWRNCLVHVMTTDVTVWPPPPPFNLLYHRFWLTSDAHVRKIEKNLADSMFASPRMQVRSSIHHSQLFSAAWMPLRATTFFNTIERNRVAAIVLRVHAIEDVHALAETLSRYQEDGFADVIVLQRCDDDDNSTSIDQQLEQLLSSQRYTRMVEGDLRELIEAANAPTMCGHDVFYRTSRTDSYPLMPTMFMSTTNYGRWTNQMIQDGRVISLLKDVCARGNDTDTIACTRTHVPSERHVHQGALTLMYNLTDIAQQLGRPNRILSITELVTIDTIGWCDDVSNDSNPNTCHSIDNLISCSNDGCVSKDNNTRRCWTHLTMDARASAWPIVLSNGSMIPAVPATISYDDKCKKHVNDIISTDPGIYYGGSDAHWQDKWDKLGIALDTHWLGYSEVIDELASRQYTIFERRLRRYWRLPENAPIRTIGLHLRMSDYDWVTSKTTLWADAVNHAQHYLGNTTSDPLPVHGFILCSDNTGHETFLQILNSHPNIPKLDCITDLTFDRGSFGYSNGVIQYMLARTTCFVGMVLSSYSQRVELRRRAFDRFMHPCDTLIAPTDDRDRPTWMWSIGASPKFYRNPPAVVTRAPGDKRPLPRW